MARISKAEREQAICQFVTTMVDSASKQTMQDRERFNIALNLFKGIQDFGAERDDNPQLSRVFIHEFSKICRRAAQAAQDIVFQGTDFFDLLPPEGEEADLFGQIVEKIVRYRVGQLDLETVFYDFCLMGGVYGVGIAKLYVDQFLEMKPEFRIEKLAKQEKKQIDSLGDKVEKQEVILADDASEDQIIAEAQDVFTEVFGQNVSYKAEVVPKYDYKRKLCIDIINPSNYYFEPDCKDLNKTPWEGEKSFVKLYQLEPLFKAGVLDKNKRKQLKGSSYAVNRAVGTSSAAETYDGQKLNERDQYTDTSPYTPVVELIEYHGSLLSKDGEVLEEDCWFVVANGKVLLKDAKNPNWNKKRPYYKTIFSKIPNKAIGAGIADNAINQQMLINNLMSLLVDLMTFSALGVKVANVDEIVDQEELIGGLKPGQVIKARTTDPNKILGDVKFNENAAFPILQTIEKLSYSGEVGSGVDTSNSNPSSRARISAAEVQSNIDRSVTSLMSLARDLDKNFIQETIQRVLDYVLQYDFERVSLDELKDSGVISETEYNLIANIPARERYKEITRHYQIQVRGFREKLERNDFLSRIVEFMQQINQMPVAQEKINWNEMLKLLIEAYFRDKISLDRLLLQNTPLDQAREENAIMATGHFISIGEQDLDDQHLLAHYEGLQRGASEQLINHAMAHVQRMVEMGMQPPEPSPEVAQLLGLDQIQQPPMQQQKALPQ